VTSFIRFTRRGAEFEITDELKLKLKTKIRLTSLWNGPLVLNKLDHAKFAFCNFVAKNRTISLHDVQNVLDLLPSIFCVILNYLAICFASLFEQVNCN